jgi:hypothetical protein
MWALKLIINWAHISGLIQGDPLSPILFNIVVHMLAIILSRAKDEGQINGVVTHLVENNLSILQYADDTVLFFDHDIEQAKKIETFAWYF